MVRQSDPSSINVLFLSANPEETQPLELIKECNNIRDKIKSAEYGNQFKFDQRHEVSAARLDEFLLDYKPQIVHFSGHGSDGGMIMFQDVDGRAEGSEIKDVANLFRILNERDSITKDKKIRCVVLNACYAEKQARPISKYVDCVVGMKNAIRDDAARIFAESFYYSLCSGQSVYTAFELGKNKVARLSIPGQDIPKLLPHVNIDPKKIVFVGNGADIHVSSADRNGPRVGIKQNVKKANELTGIRAKKMSRGSANARQNIDEAMNVKGIDIEEIG